MTVAAEAGGGAREEGQGGEGGGREEGQTGVRVGRRVSGEGSCSSSSSGSRRGGGVRRVNSPQGCQPAPPPPPAWAAWCAGFGGCGGGKKGGTPEPSSTPPGSADKPSTCRAVWNTRLVQKTPDDSKEACLGFWSVWVLRLRDQELRALGL